MSSLLGVGAELVAAATVVMPLGSVWLRSLVPLMDLRRLNIFSILIVDAVLVTLLSPHVHHATTFKCITKYIITLIIVVKSHIFCVKPLSHQMALPQHLYSVLKPCQRAVGSPRNTPKNIKFASYSVYTTSSQRPYSVHMTFPQRLNSVHDVFTARKELLQRVHGAYMARTQRSHGAHTAFSQRAQSVLTAIIAFKIFYLSFYILSNPIVQT